VHFISYAQAYLSYTSNNFSIPSHRTINSTRTQSTEELSKTLKFVVWRSKIVSLPRRYSFSGQTTLCRGGYLYYQHKHWNTIRNFPFYKITYVNMTYASCYEQMDNLKLFNCSVKMHNLKSLNSRLAVLAIWFRIWPFQEDKGIKA
jgi:hypothetical protein